jgi:multiple sugar transport system substrate-binding protein
MFWGDKGEDLEQTALIKNAESACPGLHVNGNWDQGNYDTDLATKVGSGNAPDLFLLDTKRLPEYASQGALQSIDSYVKKDKLSLKKYFWPNCLPLTVYHGKTYGLERDCGNNGMLLYNKDMFKARKVPFPTSHWTYSQLASAAVKLTGTYATKTDPTSKLRFGIGINRDDVRLNMYIWAWGGNWISSNLHSCGLTSAAARSALSFWHDLAYKKHGASTPAQENAVSGQQTGFTNQRYAMFFAGPWALNYVVRPSSYTGSRPGPKVTRGRCCRRSSPCTRSPRTSRRPGGCSST